MFTPGEMFQFCADDTICKCGQPSSRHFWLKNSPQRAYRGNCKQFMPDDGIEVTAKGGKHSKIKTALTLIPPKALLQVGAVLKPAADKYGIDNWRGIDRRAHLDHALQHIFAYLAGEDTGEPDLVNATCRLLFAIECE